jgi:hypothetical protein
VTDYCTVFSETDERAAMLRAIRSAAVLTRILRFHLAAGVVAEPSLLHAQWMERAVLAAAATANALVFDGEELLSGGGDTVLASKPRKGTNEPNHSVPCSSSANSWRSIRSRRSRKSRVTLKCSVSS